MTTRLARISRLFNDAAERHAAESSALSTLLTQVAMLVCIDERVLPENLLGLPLGAVWAIHVPGGAVDFSDPVFSQAFMRWADRAVELGNPALLMCTYHFSHTDKANGCVAFGYDTELAKSEVEKRVVAVRERWWQPGDEIVYPILVGIDTDNDTMVFHGMNGQKLDTSDIFLDDAPGVMHDIRSMFPDMPQVMMDDLMVMINNNTAHVCSVAAQRPEEEFVHRAQVIAIGDGSALDWIDVHNGSFKITSTVIGDSIERALIIAARIVQETRLSGRVDASEHPALIICTEVGCLTDYTVEQAHEQTALLADFAMGVIGRNFPDLMDIQPVFGIVYPDFTFETTPTKYGTEDSPSFASPPGAPQAHQVRAK